MFTFCMRKKPGKRQASEGAQKWDNETFRRNPAEPAWPEVAPSLYVQEDTAEGPSPTVLETISEGPTSRQNSGDLEPKSSHSPAMPTTPAAAHERGSKQPRAKDASPLLETAQTYQSTLESGYTEALLDLTGSKEVLVGRMHDRVMEFVEVRAEPRSLKGALLSSQDLIRQAMVEDEVRDELYIQLLRVSRSGGGVAALRGWELLLLVASTMPPSKEYKGLVREYVDAVCSADANMLRPHIQMVARRVQAALATACTHGMRKNVPSLAELESQVLDKRMSITVYLVDHTCVQVPVQLGSTVGGCIPVIAGLLNLENYQSFGLFMSQKMDEWVTSCGAPFEEEHSMIDADEYVGDVRQQAQKGGGPAKCLLFKKALFSAGDNDVEEPRFQELCFLQIQQDFLKGRYPLEPKETHILTALQIHATKMTSSDRLLSDADALKEVILELSPFEHAQSQDVEAWTADVAICYRRFAGLKRQDAWKQFLRILDNKPFGRSVFFPVAAAGSSQENDLTRSTTIAINRRGLHFFKDKPYALVGSAGLHEICSYGSSKKAIFFKLKKENTLSVYRFHTPGGAIICGLLQQLINYAFMRKFRANAEFLASAAPKGLPSPEPEPEEKQALPSPDPKVDQGLEGEAQSRADQGQDASRSMEVSTGDVQKDAKEVKIWTEHRGEDQQSGGNETELLDSGQTLFSLDVSEAHSKFGNFGQRDGASAERQHPSLPRVEGGEGAVVGDAGSVHSTQHHVQEAPANALLQQHNGFTARADSKADAHEPHAADGPNQPTDNLVSECDYLNAKLKDAEAEVGSLRKALGAASASITDQESKIDALERECQELRLDVSISQTLITPGSPLDGKDVELRRVKAAHGDLLAQFSRLQAARDRLASRLQEVDPGLLPPQPSVYPEAPSGLFKPINGGESAVVFELWRMAEENAVLRRRIAQYEGDMEKLVATSQLGHQNAKQKLQYHLSWKKELEASKVECTVLSRERFQLEQCVRYLAVRCGLAAATTDVTASQVREPAINLLPQSLAATALHYPKSIVNSSRLPDLTLHTAASRQVSEQGLMSSEDSSTIASIISSVPGGKVENIVENNILQLVASICQHGPRGATNDQSAGSGVSSQQQETGRQATGREGSRFGRPAAGAQRIPKQVVDPDVGRKSPPSKIPKLAPRK